MRFCVAQRFAQIALALSIVAAASAARADSAPVLVVPGKRGVPVIINNYDATRATIEGEFGLDRPGHMPITIIGGRYLGPAPRYSRGNGYYPTSGEKPVQGRYEVEPPENRELPKPAESFSRSWSSAPEPVAPADLPLNNQGNGTEAVPGMPPVIVAPQIGPRRRP